jgi:transcriptional regulator with XRE-family HTH domain
MIAMTSPAKRTELSVSIRELRTTLDVTQVELALKLGVQPSTVYRYEAGISRPPNSTLRKLAILAVGIHRPDLATEFVRPVSADTGVSEEQLLESIKRVA